ncbi:DUF868 family protein [Medicago truncatula]|uniref:DUF868 family protein n=1 Tax=Medicago truncatula TaxID=3880 RepID=G7ZUM4_MEDTR|nr:DUF868 family protein [Medicago truncatula]
MGLMGQFNVYGTDDPSTQCLCKVDIKPWMFSKRKGCKSLEAYYVCWDLSNYFKVRVEQLCRKVYPRAQGSYPGSLAHTFFPLRSSMLGVQTRKQR